MKHETHPVKFQTPMSLEDIKNTPRTDESTTFVISPDPSWFVGESNYPFNFPAWYEEKVKEGVFRRDEKIICNYVTDHDFGFRSNSIIVRYPRLKIEPDSQPVIDYYQGTNINGSLSKNYCRFSNTTNKKLVSEHILASTPQGKAWFKIAQSIYKELKLPEETVPCSPLGYYQQLKMVFSSSVHSEVFENFIQLMGDPGQFSRLNLIISDLRKQIAKTGYCTQDKIESQASVEFYLTFHKLMNKLVTITPVVPEEEMTPETVVITSKVFTEISELLESVLELSFRIFGVHSNTCGNQVGKKIVEDSINDQPYPG